MNRIPWMMWDLSTGGPAADGDTFETMRALERALEAPAARIIPACCTCIST